MATNDVSSEVNTAFCNLTTDRQQELISEAQRNAEYKAWEAKAFANSPPKGFPTGTQPLFAKPSKFPQPPASYPVLGKPSGRVSPCKSSPPNARAHRLSKLVETWALLDPDLDVLLEDFIEDVSSCPDDIFIRQATHMGTIRRTRKRHEALMKNNRRGRQPRHNESHLKRCAHDENCYQEQLNWVCNKCDKKICGAHKDWCGNVNCGSKRI